LRQGRLAVAYNNSAAKKEWQAWAKRKSLLERSCFLLLNKLFP
jgi:hypothetical protein